MNGWKSTRRLHSSKVFRAGDDEVALVIKIEFAREINFLLTLWCICTRILSTRKAEATLISLPISNDAEADNNTRADQIQSSTEASVSCSGRLGRLFSTRPAEAKESQDRFTLDLPERR